jgi:hypothetical protein
VLALIPSTGVKNPEETLLDFKDNGYKVESLFRKLSEPRILYF